MRNAELLRHTFLHEGFLDESAVFECDGDHVGKREKHVRAFLFEFVRPFVDDPEQADPTTVTGERNERERSALRTEPFGFSQSVIR